MTGNELKTLLQKLDTLRDQIRDEFVKRLRELEEIAKEKGITAFGWVEGDIQDSDGEEWEKKNNAYTTGFYEEGDAFDYGNPCEGYAFQIEDGTVYFTRILDLVAEEYYDDVYVKFDIYNPQHVCLFPHILRIAENDLGL